MIVYGKQIFMHILNKHPHLIKEIYLAKEVDKKLFSKIIKLDKKIIKLDNKKAQALAHGGNHQGFFLDIGGYKFSDLKDVKGSNFIVILYNVTDAGNIGSIVRSVYALGADAIIVSGIQSIKSEAIMRSSSGAMLEIPIVIHKDTSTLINELKQVEFKIYAASVDGVDVKTLTFPTKKALIMGSEGEGISNKILKLCDQQISIKMDRDFDSLNVSVATAILCDHMRK